MNEIYLNPENPGSFGGRNRFAKAVFRKEPTTTWREITQYLAGSDSYTLHKQITRKFARNRIILLGPNDLWQSDIADMSKISQHNDGNKYILLTIDCFSKYVWCQPTTAKTAASIAGKLAELIESVERKPTNWQTDKGGEFVNAKVQKLMNDQSINFYSTNNPDTKAAIAERAIRTIKSRIYRYFTAKNTRRYIDILDKIVNSYNNSYHRSIKMKPVEVTDENALQVKANLYPPTTNLKVQFRFKVGDLVRLAKEKSAFSKGYEQGWTLEQFKVAKHLPRVPPVYKLVDLNGEEISGTFYSQELQKVEQKDEFYKVEKILDKRTRQGKVEYLVKWLGYPSTFSSWEPATNIRAI